MTKISFSSLLGRFKKLILTIVAIAAFFLYYNVFLVDHTLENLQFSLEQTAIAYNVDDLSGLDIILSKTIAKEISPFDVNARNTANLEYAKSIVTEGKKFQQLDRMKLALGEVIKEKKRKRGIFLNTFDRVNRGIKKKWTELASVDQEEQRHEGLVRVGEKLFKQLDTIEKRSDPQEAVLGYQELIKKYLKHPKLPLIKLKLAHTYQRLEEYDKAKTLYQEISRMPFAEKETKIATILLSDLEKNDQLRKKIERMVAKAKKLSTDQTYEKQEILYEVGMMHTAALNTKGAIDFFERVIELDPSGEVALKARFTRAWLHKQENNLEASREEFQELQEGDHDPDFMFSVGYQISNIQHKQGEHEKAAQGLLALAEEHENDSQLASLSLYQAAASYEDDLNQPEKAKEIFDKLTKEYPHTPYSKHIVEETNARKIMGTILPKITRKISSRVMGWIGLSGYSGEIVKFKISTTETQVHEGFKKWLKGKTPEGSEVVFTGEGAIVEGNTSVESFKLTFDLDWQWEVTSTKSLIFKIKSFHIEKFPVPPALANAIMSPVMKLFEENIPLEVTKLSMEGKEGILEGYTDRNILATAIKDVRKIFPFEEEHTAINDPNEREEVYAALKKRFPEAQFDSTSDGKNAKMDTENLFFDFFTRFSLYTTYKLAELLDQTNFDYEIIPMTIGKFVVKGDRFRMNFNEANINQEADRYLNADFPMLVDKNFLIDLRELKIDFKNEGDIQFSTNLHLAKGDYRDFVPQEIRVHGKFIYEIDKESGIARIVFKELNLNEDPFPVSKLNQISTRCLQILKDQRVPLSIEEIIIDEEGIQFSGEGAGSVTEKLFVQEGFFNIFGLTVQDLSIMNVKRKRL